MMRAAYRAVLKAFIWTCLVFDILLMSSFVSAQSKPADPVERPRVIRTEKSPAERKIEKFDCWTGKTDQKTIPGHAIVSLPGDDSVKRVNSQIGFEIWLEGREGTLYAFCP
jgi:hypothetical protein